MNDGYPEKEELDRVRLWPAGDWLSMMKFIRERWAYEPMGYWHESTSTPTDKGVLFRLSTAGWSGNEDLITALEENALFWSLCWRSSRRGGHYEFVV